MDRIRDGLKSYLGEEEFLFVFPSEVVAGFWRREAVLAGYAEAVRPSRFVSWDTFKERAFTVRKEERPVNSFARNVFASSYLSRNTVERDLLPGYIDPEYADNSPALQQFLAKNLPSLKSSVEAGIDESGELRSLLEEYEKFLETNTLFEPKYEPLTFRETGIRAVLFFPELLEDFEEFEKDLRASGGVVFVSPGTAESGPGIPEAESPKHEARVFENSRIETKYIVNRIMRILSRGEAEPQEIWITLADESIASELTTLARLSGLPLEFKKGRPLSEYMPVRLFDGIRECVESGYAPAALGRLLLNSSLPWRDPEANRELVRFGIENYGLRNYRLAGKHRDRWEEELSKAGRKGLLGRYRKLRNRCSGILGAGSFRKLVEEIEGFSETFFSPGGWTEEERKIFQLALEVVEELDLEASGISGSSGIRPFQFFLQTLEENPYVVPTPGEGIPVYGYRVSAGAEPKVHFIAGLNQTSAQVLVRKYPFHSQQKMDLFGLEDLDLTERFAGAYLRSGERVILTASAVTSAGAVLVPERLFAREGEVPVPAAAARVPGWSDFFDDEYGMWNGEADSLSLLLPMQKKGFARAERTVFRAPGDDFTDTPVAAELLERILPRLLTEGRLRVSSTSAEDFYDCPFRFLLRYGLDLEEPEAAELAVDPRTAGILLHGVLQRLFERIKASEGRFEPAKTAHYQRILEEVIPEVFAEYARTRPKFLEPAWTETMDRSRVYISNLLDLEGKHFAGYRIVELEYRAEEPLDIPCAGHPVDLIGRIDRISASNRGHLILDYKSRNILRASDVRGDSDARSLQLPLYIRLAETGGFEVTEAWYVSLKEGKYYPILFEDDSKSIDREEMEGIIEEVMELIAGMLGRIESGDFTLPREEAGPPCGGCDFRTICRERYTIRSRGAHENQ